MRLDPFEERLVACVPTVAFPLRSDELHEWLSVAGLEGDRAEWSQRLGNAQYGSREELMQALRRARIRT